MKTKDIMLKSRQTNPAPRIATKKPGPRNTAKLNFESLCKLRAGLRMKAVDGRISEAEMNLARELENLPPVMPNPVKTPGTTDAAYNKVWDDFTARMNKALPVIEKLRAKAGVR